LHPGLRPQTEQHSESPFRGPSPFGIREAHGLDEHTFLQNAEQRIDDFLSQGKEALDNLIDQRNVLKGTQRRLLDAANTVGLSRNVIGWIEKRRLVRLASLPRAYIQRILQYSGYVHLHRRGYIHFLLLLPYLESAWLSLMAVL
jgi:hypothetical protein